MVLDDSIRANYHFGMSDLRELREAADLSQAALAQLAGTSQPQIKRLEAGERKMTRDWAERLAPHLGVPAQRLIFAPETVAVVGYVGAGAETHLFSEAQGPFETIPAPEGSNENTVAVEIRGESMGPLLDRWLAIYDDVRRPATPDLIHKLCVVGLEDGRVLIKKIQRSRTPGLYHLLSQTEAPILDVPIMWAAQVKRLVPR